jgi:hypothetical protein
VDATIFACIAKQPDKLIVWDCGKPAETIPPISMPRLAAPLPIFI